MEHNSIVLNLVVLAVNLLMMISVGLSLEARHFIALSRLKASVIGLLVLQSITLPLIGVLVVSLFSLPPATKTGVLLLAACPVGDIANFYVVLARANASLAVTLNTLSCALAALTMPVVFVAYSALLGDNFSYSVPYSTLIVRLILLSLFPLIVGMVLRRRNSSWALTLLKPLRILCTAGILFLVTNMFIYERERLAAVWRPTFLAASCLLIVSTLVGIGAAKALRLPDKHAFGGSISFPVRNIGLALAMSVSLPHGAEYASFAVIFFLVEVPILLGRVSYHLWFGARDEDPTRRESSFVADS
jgi:BASS family bile acid:Na+ symporter